jgi:hypothetical protein
VVRLEKERMTAAVPQFEYPVETWFVGNDYDQIPPHMREAIEMYVIERKCTGDFLRAVITNDLRNAVGRADDTNLPLLPIYVRWFYNRAPASCHGSPARFEAWLQGSDDA